MGSRPWRMADGIGYQEVGRGDLDYLLCKLILKGETRRRRVSW